MSTTFTIGGCPRPAHESSDFEATRTFYTEMLRLEEGSFGGGYVSFGSGHAPVVFRAARRDARAARYGGRRSREAVDAAHVTAVRSGHEVSYGPVDEPWGVRRLFVRDPRWVVITCWRTTDPRPLPHPRAYLERVPATARTRHRDQFVHRLAIALLVAHSETLAGRSRRFPVSSNGRAGRARGKRDVRAAPQRVLRVASSLAVARLLRASLTICRRCRRSPGRSVAGSGRRGSPPRDTIRRSRRL